MEREVEKVTTVDIGKSRWLYITRAMIAESGQTPGYLGCMGVQKFHDESCRKRFERIYLHTAVVPTSATSVLSKDDAPEVLEAPAGADDDGEASAETSGSGERTGSNDSHLGFKCFCSNVRCPLLGVATSE